MLFLRGIYEGLFLSNADNNPKYYTRISYKNLSNALDQFYSEYSNLDIFIVWALEIISMEMRGESKEIVDTKLREMRKKISAFKENKKSE